MEFLGLEYPSPHRIFHKYGKPVLKPDSGVYWRSKAVFNPAVYLDRNGQVKMIYRAVGEYYRYISRFGLAVSEDGVEFRHVGRDPVMIPIDDGEWWGVEDPRISIIDDRLVLTYVKWNKRYTKIGFAEVKDKGEEIDVLRRGIVDKPINDKNAVVVQTDQGLVLIHRPWTWGVRPSIWCTSISSIDGVIEASPKASWILYETPRGMIKSGIGPQPLRVGNEWLVFIHVVYPPEIYLVYAGLADRDLRRITALTPKPVLVPEPGYEWELYGDVPFVVFPSGAIVMDDRLRLYYGAGDKVVMMAEAELSELLMLLDKNRLD